MIRDREPPMSLEGAEQLAIKALAFLASEPEELGRFLALAPLALPIGLGDGWKRKRLHQQK